MFILEYKEQYAMCEKRQPLQDIIDKQPRPEKWRIVPTADSL